jgi:hypothetical protein
MAAKQPQRPTPIWLYIFLDWLKRTPLRGWLVALFLFVAGLILMHLPYWFSGRVAAYTLNQSLTFPATWLPGGLMFWLWQDLVAERVIRDFSKGTGKSEVETKSIFANFISVPSGIAIVLSLVGILSGAFFFVEQLAQVTSNPLYIFLGAVPPVLGNALEVLALYRWGRQLFQVSQLYKQVKKINLFSLGPIYALSRYGYLLALLTAVAATILDLINRFGGGPGLPLENIVYQGIIALAVFLIPLVGINNRLRTEKAQELQRLGDQLNSVYNETEAAVRRRKLAKVGDLRNASAALREQIDSVQKVATWPWNPGSLRNLLLPVLLPLFLAVLQRYLLNFLGF